MSNPNQTITIHHFDDEPATASALRDNLPAMLIAHEPDWIKLDEYPDGDAQDNGSWIMKVHLDADKVIEIRYCIYRVSEEFLAANGIRPSDIVLLDAFERSANGEHNCVVDACLAHVKEKVGSDRIMILSAYYNEHEEAKKVCPAANIITKPYDINSMALRLLKLSDVPLVPYEAD